MIVFGTRWFGFVDRVEGLGTVATRFFHVMFVPLIPLEGGLVEGNRYVKIALSPRSVAVAWLRSALFWGAALAVLVAPASFGLSLCAALPLGLGYGMIPSMTRTASAERAEAIRREVGRRA